MKKILITLLCLCLLEVPIVVAEVHHLQPTETGIIELKIDLSLLGRGTRGEHSELMDNEQTENLRLIYYDQSGSVYLKFTTRIWKLNPSYGDNWYIISMQTDAINEKVRANSLSHSIDIWTNFRGRIVYHKPDILYNRERRATYEPIYCREYDDIDERYQWVEDIKVGIVEDEPMNHWGWLNDNGRFNGFWELYRGNVEHLGLDYWVWEEDTKVRQAHIHNFETVLLVGGDNIIFYLKYVYNGVDEPRGHRIDMIHAYLYE